MLTLPFVITGSETHCPYCDSQNIKALPPRSYEAESSVAWYECSACARLWFRKKQRDDDSSPESIQ